MFNLYLVYILSINSLYRFEISFRFILMLLNNPKVISAVLQNLKFPKENFESWLNLHNINASRAFGTKITFEKMKQASGVLTSVFGVVMYLLLREELRSQGYL